ncbi:transcriptional protein SWT1 isoform 2-T2 [Odontesthes bonariensis]
MSKHSKKKKRRKLSSSSSEEDEKVSKRQDGTHSRKSVTRKEDVKRHKRSGCTKEQPKSLKDDSPATHLRHFKTPVYKLQKTQPAEQKAVHKEEKHTKSKSVSAAFHEEDSSSKAKKYISAKDSTVRKSKAVECGLSKPLNTSNAASFPHKTEKASEERSDKKSSKLKRQRMSPSLGSTKQKDQKRGEQRRKCKTEEPSSTENDNNTIQTRETASSFINHSAEERRRELFKDMCKSHQVKKLKSKRSLSTDTKNISASITETSSSSVKHTTSESSSKVLKNVSTTGVSETPVSHNTAQSSSTAKQMLSLKFVPFKFKIPKKVQPRPLQRSGENNAAVSANKNLKQGNKLSVSGDLLRKVEQKIAQQARTCLDVTPDFPVEEQDKKSALSDQLPPTADTSPEPEYDQTQVAAELHLARSEKRLEVNLMQSYGELTCMDIDSPEEAPADSPCSQPRQQELIVVLDTNILLSHLDYVKKIISHGLGALGFPVVLIPWVVLQELDSLKRGRGLSGSVAHLATPAISYIYNALKNREPHLWGQSMQQAAESSNGLTAENNDDRVLQCCLQYQNMYPECALILCTNDKNLCSKALLSGVRALCNSDLQAEVEKSRHGLHVLQNNPARTLPHASPQISSPVLSRTSTPAPPHSPAKTCLSEGVLEKDDKGISGGDDDETKQKLSRCLSELEDCLLEVLSDVLEVEMKAAYEDLWLEIVIIKPPWTLQDVLQCLKKHWIAVFGHVVPRRMLETVLTLINFFSSGERVDCSKTSAALQEAKDLVKAFWKSSNHVPRVISAMENIFIKLQPQQHLSVAEESFAGDVVMNDDEEDKRLTSAQVSHQEVWAVFENIWSKVYQTSLEVFKALGFDPHTTNAALPVGGPSPPQDALACLHRLSFMVSQLLQAFSSVLLSAPGLEEAQALLSIIRSNEIVNEDSRLTAKDLLDCFTQPDYREKLRVGGSQLMELKEALDRCVQATGQQIPFSTQS